MEDLIGGRGSGEIEINQLKEHLSILGLIDDLETLKKTRWMPILKAEDEITV